MPNEIYSSEKHNGHAQGLSAAKESFKEAGQNLKDATQSLGYEAKEQAEFAMTEARKHSAELKNAVSSYVQKNPFKSLGWSLLAGFTLGMLLRK